MDIPLTTVTPPPGPAIPPRETAAAPKMVPQTRQNSSADAERGTSVAEVIKEIQQSVGNNTTVQFTVDDATGRTIVSVIDAETKEVVRQIPAEDVMKVARSMSRLQGLLFNGKA